MAADPTTSRTVDDILLEDAGFDSDDDPFNDTRPPRNTERDDKPTLSPRKRKAADEDVFGKNVDEEVKITKQRKKIPKLDAERLLSEPGIPKMRTLLRSGQFQKKLRLKGKGHEFPDAARLLNYYQLWLDTLYPRAKFVDAIQLVEKAGHTKKMQMYRKSWIDEGKPGFIRLEHVDEAMENQNAVLVEQSTTAVPSNQRSATPDSVDEDPSLLFFTSGDHEVPAAPDGPDDDELDALMAQAPNEMVPVRTKVVANNDDSEGEDDLDALLAQESTRDTNRSSARPQTNKVQQRGEILARDLENSQEHDEPDELVNESATISARAGQIADNFEDEDMDDLDALLNSHNATAEPELPAIPADAHENPLGKDVNATNSEDVPELVDTVSSSPIPNIELDELDDLLNEHDATLRKKVDTEIVEEFIASSPIPGQESQ